MKMEKCKLNCVLKYPGSKWRIVDKLVELIPPHHTYLEPYLGSGAVFFRKAPSDIETINDLDWDVVNLFQCIREDSEKLSRLIMTTPYSRQMYDDAFKSDPVAEMMLGADRFHKACQFLVRCWQGHGFRSNGYKVGWKNDVQGRERMYALWNWYRLPEKLVEVDLIKIQECKRHGVCNDCGKQQEADTQIWEIKVSTTGQGWTTLMMCKGCLAALNAAIAITVFNSRVH